jgi:hypothetical protein
MISSVLSFSRSNPIKIKIKNISKDDILVMENNNNIHAIAPTVI